MKVLARYRAWRAARENDRSGKVTSGRESQGSRDRAFREEKARRRSR